MVWSQIPVLGWVVAAVLHFSLACPLWFLWDKLGPVYFQFVPEPYQQIPFWHVVGLVWLVGLLKFIFVPTLASINHTVNQQTNK